MEHRTLESCGALFYCPSTKRYLFLLRNDSKHSGSWGLVGGKAEINETVMSALQREVVEEIGYTLTNEKIVPIEQFTSNDARFTFHTFLVKVEKEFVPVLNHEHRGYCWVSINDHPKPLHPGVWRSFQFEVIKQKLQLLEQIL